MCITQNKRAAVYIVHRCEQLHDGLWQIDRRSRGDEAFREYDGDVGFSCAPAEKSFPSAGRAARNPLGLGSQSQLRVYRHSANVETLVSLRGRSRRMASEGGRADR